MQDNETKSKVIDGNHFYVRAMPPLKALSLLGDIQGVITTSLSSGISNKGATLMDSEVNVGLILGGIGKNLNGPVLVQFAERILDQDYVSVKKSGETDAVRLDVNMKNELFTGKLKSMLALMYFVLEVNYEDFFGLIPILSGAVGKLGKI